MKKSKTQSEEEKSRLAAAIAEAKSHPSFSKAAESASPPSSESPPPPSSETQQIGDMIIPKFVWTALWTDGATAVRMLLGGEQVEVQAEGHWEPPMPENKASRRLPSPKHGESHQSYFLRVLALFRGRPHSPEIAEWHALRKWVGQSANALRDAIAAGQDLPGHSWKFVNERNLV